MSLVVAAVKDCDAPEPVYHKPPPKVSLYEPVVPIGNVGPNTTEPTNHCDPLF